MGLGTTTPPGKELPPLPVGVSAAFNHYAFPVIVPVAEPVNPAPPPPRLPPVPAKKTDPVFAVKLAPGIYIRYFHSVILRNGQVVKAQSDEYLPDALIEEANGSYTGKRLLAVPGHYYFMTDLVPRSEVVMINVVAKKVAPRTGVSVEEL